MDRYFIAYDLDEVRSDVYHHSEGFATFEEAWAYLETYEAQYRDSFLVYHVRIERVENEGRVVADTGSDTT